MTLADLIATVKKQPVGFACGLICLICAGLLYFRGSKIGEKRTEYETKSAEAAKILANVRNSDKLVAQVAEIQELTKELDGRLIRASQLPLNQQFFYKLEAETEVKLIEIRQNSIVRTNKPSLYTPIPFSVAVQGPFKQVLSFLQKLENGPHFCHFTSIGFAKSGGAETTDMTITMNLELLGVP